MVGRFHGGVQAQAQVLAARSGAVDRIAVETVEHAQRLLVRGHAGAQGGQDGSVGAQVDGRGAAQDAVADLAGARLGQPQRGVGQVAAGLARAAVFHAGGAAGRAGQAGVRQRVADQRAVGPRQQVVDLAGLGVAAAEVDEAPQRHGDDAQDDQRDGGLDQREAALAARPARNVHAHGCRPLPSTSWALSISLRA
ncbi:hypothetical protein WLW46_25150 [Bordetella bronchiseptica]